MPLVSRVRLGNCTARGQWAYLVLVPRNYVAGNTSEKSRFPKSAERTLLFCRAPGSVQDQLYQRPEPRTYEIFHDPFGQIESIAQIVSMCSTGSGWGSISEAISLPGHHHHIIYPYNNPISYCYPTGRRIRTSEQLSKCSKMTTMHPQRQQDPRLSLAPGPVLSTSLLHVFSLTRKLLWFLTVDNLILTC